jgi:early secretory antigenic target protein ESAT-6
MAELLEFDPASFQNLVASLRASTREIQQRLEALDAEVSRLKDSFTGAASEAYQRAQSEWRAQLSAMNDTLDRAAAVVAESGDAFAQTDKKAARSW